MTREELLEKMLTVGTTEDGVIEMSFTAEQAESLRAMAPPDDGRPVFDVSRYRARDMKPPNIELVSLDAPAFHWRPKPPPVRESSSTPTA